MSSETNHRRNVELFNFKQSLLYHTCPQFPSTHALNNSSFMYSLVTIHSTVIDNSCCCVLWPEWMYTNAIYAAVMIFNLLLKVSVCTTYRDQADLDLIVLQNVYS